MLKLLAVAIVFGAALAGCGKHDESKPYLGSADSILNPVQEGSTPASAASASSK